MKCHYVSALFLIAGLCIGASTTWALKPTEKLYNLKCDQQGNPCQHWQAVKFEEVQ